MDFFRDFGKQLSANRGRVPRLRDDLLRPGRWRLVRCGRWRKRAAIHVKEARGALAALCFAATLPSCQDKLVLGLGDNLPEVLATERGRARDYELLGVVRRGAAIRIVTGIGYLRRHAETKRNLSDYHSRELPRAAPTDLHDAHIRPSCWVRRTSVSQLRDRRRLSVLEALSAACERCRC